VRVVFALTAELPRTLLFFRWRIAFDVYVFAFEQEIHHLLLQQFAVFGFIMLSFSR
jgi:hypothetical protein